MLNPKDAGVRVQLKEGFNSLHMGELKKIYNLLQGTNLSWNDWQRRSIGVCSEAKRNTPAEQEFHKKIAAAQCVSMFCMRPFLASSGTRSSFRS
jgi:hypothetical protein